MLRMKTIVAHEDCTANVMHEECLTNVVHEDCLANVMNRLSHKCCE